MKKRIFNFVILFAVCGVGLSSCAKDPDEPETEVPVDKGSFAWQQSSGSLVTADSAHFYPQITTIYAFKNGNSNSVEINLSALSVGSYSFNSATGNTFVFFTNATTINATSGSCNITSSANNKLSGNFNVVFAGSTVAGLSGTFKDILGR